MIPQQSGKIKFCVMKFANIFLWVNLIHRISFRDSLVKKYIFLCVSHKLLYFCRQKELFDKQTYAICRI